MYVAITKYWQFCKTTVYKGKHLPRAAQTGPVSPGGDAETARHRNPRGRQGSRREKRGEGRARGERLSGLRGGHAGRNRRAAQRDPGLEHP